MALVFKNTAGRRSARLNGSIGSQNGSRSPIAPESGGGRVVCDERRDGSIDQAYARRRRPVTVNGHAAVTGERVTVALLAMDLRGRGLNAGLQGGKSALSPIAPIQGPDCAGLRTGFARRWQSIIPVVAGSGESMNSRMYDAGTWVGSVCGGVGAALKADGASSLPMWMGSTPQIPMWCRGADR